jgi:DNA polymerase-3 subunit delta
MAKETTATKFLKGGNFPEKGLVLVYGPEEVFHEAILKKLKKEKQKFQIYHGDEMDLDKFVSLLGERNLFSGAGKTVNVLLKGELFFDKLKKKQKEKLQRLLNLSISNLLLIFIQKEITKKELSKEPYKTLFGKAEIVISAKSLNKTQLTGLIKKKFQKEGIKVENEVIQFLQSAFSDTLELKNEIEKLILYALDKKTLTLSEVKELVEGNAQYSIFDFQNSFFDRNLSESLKIFKILIKGVPAYEVRVVIFQLQGLLTNTTNKLLVAKEKIQNGEELKNFAKRIGLYYPFQVSQYGKWLNLWDEEELIKVLKNLYQLDVNVKTRFLPPAEEFERFLVTTLSA